MLALFLLLVLFLVGLRSFFIVSPVHDTPVIRLCWFLFALQAGFADVCYTSFPLIFTIIGRAKSHHQRGVREKARRKAVYMLGIRFCLGFCSWMEHGFSAGFGLKAGF